MHHIREGAVLARCGLPKVLLKGISLEIQVITFEVFGIQSSRQAHMVHQSAANPCRVSSDSADILNEVLNCRGGSCMQEIRLQFYLYKKIGTSRGITIWLPQGLLSQLHL